MNKNNNKKYNAAYDLIIRNINKNPQKVAFIDNNSQITYNELFIKIKAFSYSIQSKNIKEKDKVLNEDEIQMARRYYNGTVRNNNVLVESFPSNIIANSFNFGKFDFFEIEDPSVKEVPKVEF